MNVFSKLTSLLTLWEYKKTTLEDIKKKFGSYTGKIAVISDVHIPFFDREVLNEFYDVCRDKEVKLIIFAGDLVNFDAFSRFLKLDGVVRADVEIKTAKQVLEKFVKLNKQILYLKANHELRLEKYLIRMLGNENAEDLLKLGLSFEQLFRYKQLQIVDNWFVMIGDCVICHPEVKSVIKSKPAEWIDEYLTTRIKGYKAAVIAHTHYISKLFVKRKLVIMNGSACKTLDYTLDSKFNPYRSDVQYLGFTIIQMNKGQTNLNKTNPVFVKVEDYIL